MKDYYIEFKCPNPNAIIATRISIGTEIIHDHQRQMDVSLCSHPLYSKLYQYCMSNPPPSSGEAS